MTPKVTPRVIGIVHFDGIQDDEQHAYPKLQVEIVGIIVEGYALERVDRDADDKQQAEHEGREMKGQLNILFGRHELKIEN